MYILSIIPFLLSGAGLPTVTRISLVILPALGVAGLFLFSKSRHPSFSGIGLLNLALKGLKKLIKKGSFKDVSVEKIKQQYEHNASIVRQFIDEQCAIDLNNPECHVLTSVLQNAFREFCKKRGIKELEDNILGKDLLQLAVARTTRMDVDGSG